MGGGTRRPKKRHSFNESFFQLGKGALVPHNTVTRKKGVGIDQIVAEHSGRLMEIVV